MKTAALSCIAALLLGVVAAQKALRLESIEAAVTTEK
jgi:hypothetical protein